MKHFHYGDANNRFMDWEALDAEGGLGGLVILWDVSVIQLLKKEESSFCLSCRFKNLEDEFIWSFPRVYDPNKKSMKDSLWEDLGAV